MVEIRRAKLCEEYAAELEKMKAEQDRGGRPKKGEKPTQQIGEVNRHDKETDSLRATAAGTNRQYIRDAQNNAAEIKLLAERRAGELLAGMEKQSGARGVGKKVESHDAIPLLKDMGLTKTQSSRWQLAASFPDIAPSTLDNSPCHATIPAWPRTPNQKLLMIGMTLRRITLVPQSRTILRSRTTCPMAGASITTCRIEHFQEHRPRVLWCLGNLF